MRLIFRNLNFQKPIEIAFALSLWAIYAVIGPGDEFFVGYRALVLNPNDLIPTFGHPIMFNPPWLSPILAPFITMPGRAGYILFIGLTVGILFYSTRVFEGNPIIMLISAQLFWILWWGQIDGLVIFGIALGWFAYQKHSWRLFALALLLGALKPQIGAIPLLAMWWWLGKDRWKPLAVLVIAVIVTSIIYGPWLQWVIEGVITITKSSQYFPWNSSIGLIGLPLFIPALLLNLTRSQRLIALTATAILVSPYMPYYSTLILLVFNLPWWVIIFAIIGYFPNVVGTAIAWNGIAFLPACILVWLYFPFIKLKIIKIFGEKLASS